MTGNFVAK